MESKTYNNWRAGHVGDRGSYGTDPFYEAENVQVYPSGSIGPRPGWRDLTVAGSLQMISTDILRGVLWRQESTDTVDGSGRLYGRLVLVYTNATDTLTYYEEGTLSNDTITFSGNRLSATTATRPRLSYGYPAGTPARERYRTWFNGTELTIIGGVVFEEFNMTSPTLFTPNTADGYPAGAWVHRDRAYYFGFASAPGRVYYSEPADYDNVPTANFFDVNENPTSSSGGVVDLKTVNGNLLIARADGRWNILSGVNPEDGSNRDILDTRTPRPGSTALAWNNEVWFLTDNAWGLNVANGSGVDLTSYQYMRSGALLEEAADFVDGVPLDPILSIDRNYALFPYQTTRSSSFVGQVAAFAYINGTWTVESYGGTTEHHMLTPANEGRAYMVTQDGSDLPVIYSRDICIGSPARNVDSRSSSDPLSGVAARLVLSELIASPGSVLRPVRIEVTFDYWKGNEYQTPSVDMSGRLLGVEDAADSDILLSVDDIDTGDDGVAWEDSPAGVVPKRRTSSVNLEDLPYMSSFQLRLDLVETAVRSVTIFYDERSRDLEQG